jgi:selenium metabolism protein YedF
MGGVLWYVRSDRLGPDEALGSRLIQSFFNSLGDRLEEPADFAFVNRGALLTLDDSPILEALKELESRGSRIRTCGTCLDYYDVADRLAVGEVGSMALLQESMLVTRKVITL